MSSLEPRNEKDLIAVKAGINVKYPGKFLIDYLFYVLSSLSSLDCIFDILI